MSSTRAVLMSIQAVSAGTMSGVTAGYRDRASASQLRSAICGRFVKPKTLNLLKLAVNENVQNSHKRDVNSSQIDHRSLRMCPAQCQICTPGPFAFPCVSRWLQQGKMPSGGSLPWRQL